MANCRLQMMGGRTLNVAMSAEAVSNTLGRGGMSLIALPIGEGESVYVNPAHVISAEDYDPDRSPSMGSA